MHLPSCPCRKPQCAAPHHRTWHGSDHQRSHLPLRALRLPTIAIQLMIEMIYRHIFATRLLLKAYILNNTRLLSTRML